MFILFFGSNKGKESIDHILTDKKDSCLWTSSPKNVGQLKRSYRACHGNPISPGSNRRMPSIFSIKIQKLYIKNEIRTFVKTRTGYWPENQLLVLFCQCHRDLLSSKSHGWWTRPGTRILKLLLRRQRRQNPGGMPRHDSTKPPEYSSTFFFTFLFSVFNNSFS